jgi:2-methylcitrate dehydratase PrpD
MSVAETRAGIFHAFAGLEPGTFALPARRRTELAITRCYIKPYPCCRHIHPAIDGLLELRARHGFDADEVAAIDIGTYDAAMPHATLGWDAFTTAQLSFPYVIAAAMRTGTVELATFSEQARADPLVSVDAARVRVHLDAECSAAYPRQGPARVAVTLRDGRRHETYVADPRGSPEIPMSDREVFSKFRMMVGGRLTSQAADGFIERARSLEAQGSVRPLIDMLGPALLQEFRP